MDEIWRARGSNPLTSMSLEEAEMGNTVSCRVSGGGKLTYELKNAYAQLHAFDWNN